MDAATQIEVGKLLSRIAEYRASGMHLTVGLPPILRIDDQLQALTDVPMMTPSELQKIADFLLNDIQRQQLQADKEVVFTYSLEDRARYKVSIFYQKSYLSVSLKYIPPTVKSPKELGLPSVVDGFVKLPRGLVMVTGPFGSGKTTTVASLIETINQSRSEYIITIERPIEFVFTNARSIIEQREVGRDTSSFIKALSNIPQEDVNVVMISELDDPAIIELALTIVESGRLVIASMNTDSAYKTIEKIINGFPQHKQEQIRIQLADALEGVISQRLVRRSSGGKLVAFEVLVPTSAVRAIMKEGSIYQLQTILQTSREEGMISMDRSLVELVRSGQVLMEDALEQAVDKNGLKSMIRV